MKILLGLLIAIACLTPASAVAQPLHLVLTPSQKPTDLLAAGDEFGQALAKLYGAPVRVTVASDYAAVIEALRNRTADLAFVHLNGHVDSIASFDMAREQYLSDPAEREKITFVAETPPIPEAGIAARDGLDPAAFARVRGALLQMRGPAYAALLKRMYDIDGFEPAEDRDYDPVRAAVELPGIPPR